MSSFATPPFDDPNDVVRLRMALARLARQQRRIDPDGLTPSQQSALGTIDHRGPVSLGHLAKLEAVTPPTITRIVAKLEDQGLVQRTVDPDDRRIARVSITDIGRDQMVETRQRRNQWLATKLAEVTAEDAAAIHGAVDALERLVTATAAAR
ncbi:MAG: MarR family transcriptional regulator [Actinomycetota bacterium]